jgi:hypothetical protein
MDAAAVVVGDGSPADIVISQSHQAFRRNDRRRQILRASCLALAVDFVERWR